MWIGLRSVKCKPGLKGVMALKIGWAEKEYFGFGLKEMKKENFGFEKRVD